MGYKKWVTFYLIKFTKNTKNIVFFILEEM